MADQLEPVAAGGDRVAILEGLRDRLAAEIDACDDPRALPNLVQRLESVLNTLDALPLRSPNSAADVIAARRAARRAQPGAAG